MRGNGCERDGHCIIALHVACTDMFWHDDEVYSIRYSLVPETMNNEAS
jgi:hypothetical protein